MNSIKVKIIRIGNSKGIRLSKSLTEQYNMTDEVLLKAKKDSIVIRPVENPREGWVVILFSKDFSRWILLADLIAWPIAYYAMYRWLQNFAYRIDITIWPFLLAGMVSLVIALLTVSGQAVKVATANPAESLRYE